MATSPSPFFPTTTPACAPTSVFPLPPFSFGPPPCVPCAFPSAAAAYRPPLSPGGYSTSPFPFFYSNSSAYPYPPPASAYTPASPTQAPGFFPAPAYHYTPAATAPPAVRVTSDELARSPLDCILDDSFDRAPEANDAASSTPNQELRSRRIQTSSKTSTLRPSVTSPPLPRRWAANSLLERPGMAPLLEPPSAGRPIPMETEPVLTTSEVGSYLASDAVILTAADEQVQAKDAIRHRQQIELLDIQARLDQRQAHDRTSFDTIQGEISRLSEAVARLASSMGVQKDEVQVITGSSPEVAPIQFISPATTALMFSGTGAATRSPVSFYSARFGASTTASMFSGTGAATISSASSLSSPVGASFVVSTPTPASVSATSEQHADAVPQPYGLHNLNRHSVLLADGTEHNYYALPADYPLGRATPAPLIAACVDEMGECSAELVDMFVYTPEQQTLERKLVYEDNACLNTVNDVFARTSEQKKNEEKQQESEQFANCFHKASGNEVSDHATDCTSTHVPHLFVDESIECHMTNNDTTLHSLPDYELGDTIGQVATKLWNKLLPQARRHEWDPGIAKSSFMDSGIKFNGIALWLITFNPP